ncbi:MAG: hypothetical protein ABWY29_05945 [Blastococcus sp.]
MPQTHVRALGRSLDDVLDGMLDTVRAQAALRDDTLVLGVRLCGDAGL